MGCLYPRNILLRSAYELHRLIFKLETADGAVKVSVHQTKHTQKSLLCHVDIVDISLAKLTSVRAVRNPHSFQAMVLQYIIISREDLSQIRARFGQHYCRLSEQLPPVDNS